jgi:hypothetical protein
MTRDDKISEVRTYLNAPEESIPRAIIENYLDVYPRESPLSIASRIQYLYRGPDSVATTR